MPVRQSAGAWRRGACGGDTFKLRASRRRTTSLRGHGSPSVPNKFVLRPPTHAACSHTRRGAPAGAQRTPSSSASL